MYEKLVACDYDLQKKKKEMYNEAEKKRYDACQHKLDCQQQ